MIRKNFLIYICIIIVLVSVFIRPPVVQGKCANVMARAYDFIVLAAASMKNDAERINFLAIMMDIFLYGAVACDENGNPIAIPTIDPSLPSPTPDPNAPPTPTIDPNAPTPDPKVSSDEVQYAEKLVQLANQFCNGIVTSNNEACMDNFSSIMDSSSISVFKGFPHDTGGIDWKGDTDPPYNETTYLQCVTCARGMPSARGRPYDGRGDAKYHAGLPVTGYTYYENTPENVKLQLVPKSLFINTTGVYGHIGYITEVLYDSQNQVYGIKVFECNWSAYGSVKHGRTILINSIAGWQKPNNL